MAPTCIQTANASSDAQPSEAVRTIIAGPDQRNSGDTQLASPIRNMYCSVRRSGDSYLDTGAESIVFYGDFMLLRR